MSRHLHALFLCLGLAAGLGAQTLDLQISLADPSTVVDDDPFGLAVDPDGTHVYVALAGDFDPNFPSTPSTAALFNGMRIAKVDIFTGTVVATGPTGLFPEEIALTLDASGNTRHVFVTNSTDGTVSILDSSLNLLLTVPLTPCFGANFGAVFPFGILASPDGSRVYVGTVGGCGTIDVIDSDPVSPTFAQIVDTFTVSNISGRMAWLNWPQMVIAATDFATLSAGITVVDVTNPSSTVYLPGFSHPGSFGFGPGASDVAVRPGGTVLLTVSFADVPRLLEMDPLTGSVLQNLDLSAAASANSLHGLGLSADGRTAVVTVLGGQGEVVFVDVPGGTVIASLPQGTGQPNEAVFSLDQSRVIVSLQQGEEIRTFRSLPWYGLELEVDPVTNLGQTLTVALTGVEFGRPAALYASLTGPGPQVISGFTVHLDAPIVLVSQLTGEAAGTSAWQTPVPSDPALTGVPVWFQAATLDRDGGLRLSNGGGTIFN